ncbi:MAG: nuclear transport factor 2 family protein [Pseudomonadota bacterium]
MNQTTFPDVETAKTLASQFEEAWLQDPVETVATSLKALVTPDYQWRGSRPFYEQPGVDDLCASVIEPMRRAFAGLERREFLKIAGTNDANEGAEIWTCSLGVLTGAFVAEWLGLKPTNRLVQIRYAEFHEVAGERIAQSAFFIDLADVLQQIGLDPFPRQLGARHIFPAPLKGLRATGATSVEQGAKTMALLNRMIEDLDLLNKSGQDTCTPEYLARCWREDMGWYGPAGIGAMKTIELYQAQHQYPFRQGLKNKQYHGHIARFAEGDFAAFFGWPNLTNTPRGGYLGLPESEERGEMRVVDVYRREGEKLAENWVIIDLPHYFMSFGVDLIANAIATQRQ